MSLYSLLICLLLLSSVVALPSTKRHLGRTAARLKDVYNPLIANRQVKANDLRSGGTPTRRQNQCANPGPSGCPCTVGQTMCDSGCTDTTADPNNCGACGTTCLDIQTCADSVCTDCPFGDISCDNTCVVANSATYCGACDITCPSYLYCYAPPGGTGPWGFDYSCGCPYLGLPEGVVNTNCNGACVDLTSDPNNCGACGTTCLDIQTCTGSVCTDCPFGDISCDNTCVVANSATYCGACDITCPSYLYCYAPPGGTGPWGFDYSCGCPYLGLPEGVVNTNCNGACVDLSSDTSNCGTCGTECSGSTPYCAGGTCSACMDADETYCDGTCILTSDFQTDDLNCGSCGTQCTAPETCISGECSCPSGENLCNGACVNYQTDINNCGTCSTYAPYADCAARLPGLPCTNGECVCPSNTPTYCPNLVGCFDLTSNTEACGYCGLACSAYPGQQCVESTCVCPEGDSYCPGWCVSDFQTDPNNCGICNNGCTSYAGQPCSGGECYCPDEYINCDGECVLSFENDNNNCGGCFLQCLDGSTCEGGSCVCPGAPEYGYCSVSCTDLLTDSSNCGSCDTQCSAPLSDCIGGVCSCPPGEAC